MLIIGALMILIIWNGCKKPYNPQIISVPNNYLVVEGFINSGADSTIFSLSRTVNLDNKVTVNPELNAQVTIENDQNNIYPLTEAPDGKYFIAGLTLNQTQKYRLRIKTVSSNEYVSDFVPVLNSPPIDSVSYTIKSDGVDFSVNTHDPNNNTRYYRWDYGETWIFHANFFSQFKSNGDTVLFRDLQNDQIYQCWQHDTSSTITLGSSAKLTSDVILNQPLTSVSSTSEKFTTRYSILVRQSALTSSAYSFWQNLKKNTEQLGSIFDAQPSQIGGNIHSTTNPNEPVIGYLSAGATSVKRIYINNIQLPNWLPTPFYTDCKIVPACCYFVYVPPNTHDQPINQENLFFNVNKGSNQLIPVTSIGLPGQPPIGHTGTTPECADCTLRGTNKQPAFWK